MDHAYDNNKPVPTDIETAQLADTASYHGLSTKPKMFVLLLCIFLGFLGVHRFYVGKVATGTLYMVSGGCLVLGWAADIFNICIGNFSDKTGHFIQ